MVKGVNPDLALFVAEHESLFDPTLTGDTKITCKRTGEAVYARGLYQITRCFHPEITDADAYDPDFSILWAIPQMKDMKTCKQVWVACRYYTPPVPIKDVGFDGS